MGRAQVARNQVTLGVGPWCLDALEIPIETPIGLPGLKATASWRPCGIPCTMVWVAAPVSQSMHLPSFAVHQFIDLRKPSSKLGFFSHQIHFNIGFSCRRCFSTSPGNICLDDFARMYVSFKTGGPSNSKGSSSQCGQNLRSLCSGWGSLCLPEASIQNQHQIKAVFQTLARLIWSTETCELYVNRGAGHGEVLNYGPLLSYFPCEDHKKAPKIATGFYTGQVWRWASSYLPRLWLGPTNRQPDAGKAPSKHTSFHLDMDSSHIASPKPI